MPIYVYETVPAAAGEASERFELRQSMHEAPLTEHPDTRVPVRRVLSGGLVTFTQGAAADRGAMPARGCGASACCMTQ
ncbi:MAG: FmdB family zinc ribbon protein [Gemmatimonas sp.]|jgi:predicted nucleic acid-binding Zn ribbon protein|uniref:FmdB family zinc ribbon protein n=1 Tax=Gemmatimonas sp. TaxID=1962908 RepID=UPI00391F74EC|nr:zinc ribbon domain-containing protein [Gemmatimonadota bacterium]